jgi:hypothetical protein
LQIEQNPDVLPQPVVATAKRSKPQPSDNRGAPGGGQSPGNSEPKAALNTSAKVIQVTGATVTISIGENAGVKIGDRFDVSRIKEIPDPDNPATPHVLADKIGVLVIMKVYETAAVGKYTGTRPATVKDRVTPKH